MTEAHTDASPRERRKPSLRVRAAVVLTSLLVGLLIFEVFLRAVGYTYPIFYEPDAARGYRLQAGREGWQTKEGRAYVRVNSDGLRDREHAKEKPPNTVRVAVLGDSYAEAAQVEREEAFWAVMESRLAGCPSLSGRAVEVINFGVSGYGTAQELITLREKVWDYSPDVVLLAVTTNNDAIDNVRALKASDDMPYFVLRGGRLELDNSFRDTAAFRRRTSLVGRAGRWLHANLRFVQAVHQAQAALKSKLALRRARQAAEDERRRRPQTAPDAPQSPPPAPKGGDFDILVNMVYSEPRGETWREAWEVTERLIAEMRREVEARGARFAVATLSSPIQVYPEARARADFMTRVGAADIFYPDRRLADLGRREGFAVFTLAPELQAHADAHKVFLHGFPGDLGNGHWNRDGHRLAGELLSDKLCGFLTK
ncbi:MAG TPA: SGNH/GDSL hydrolase family protein [Pyrinomonadaceae bacterium]|nr:SGNH/GDSL hydrolase family protein [Pyrinomonadaceae bacterium]